MHMAHVGESGRKTLGLRQTGITCNWKDNKMGHREISRWWDCEVVGTDSGWREQPPVIFLRWNLWVILPDLLCCFLPTTSVAL